MAEIETLKRSYIIEWSYQGLLCMFGATLAKRWLKFDLFANLDQAPRLVGSKA
jgi:hypothetical protein